MPGNLDTNYADDVTWIKKRAERSDLTAKRLGANRVQKSRGRQDEPVPAPVGALSGIVAERQPLMSLLMHDGEFLTAYHADSTMAADVPTLVVGDRVTFDLIDNEPILRSVLPRENKLARMRLDGGRRSGIGHEHILAANVDLAVIVAAAVSPPFRPRLVDRYLVLCKYGGVSPLICLNKCDLADAPPDLSAYERMGIPVIPTSMKTGEGVRVLRAALRGKTSILTGHSGVGKSSILNRLLGDEVQETQEVGQSDGLGRHTTTAASLYILKGKSYLIDTPGIRSLGLWDIDRHTLPLYFPEFDRYAPDCKFRDCLHKTEPDCAVKAAAAHGDIPDGWYDSYLRLAAE